MIGNLIPNCITIKKKHINRCIQNELKQTKKNLL